MDSLVEGSLLSGSDGDSNSNEDDTDDYNQGLFEPSEEEPAALSEVGRGHASEGSRKAASLEALQL